MPRDLSFGLNAQVGNMQLLQAEISYYLTNSLFIHGAYHISRQAYESTYITTRCLDCGINFHGLWVGIGYELYRCWNRYNGAFVNTTLLYGAELAHNADLFQEHDPLSLFNQAIKPGIQFGWRYKNTALFLGINYTAWVHHTMNTEREPLYDAGYDTRIHWGDDLFPGRKGTNIIFGLKFFIRRLK